MTPEEQARALVARWEHGDAVHRQWLRDAAVPDLIAALTPGPEVVAERAVAEAAQVWRSEKDVRAWSKAVEDLVAAVDERSRLIRLRTAPAS